MRPFRPGVSARAFSYLGYYTWSRCRWLRRKHHRATWKDLRRLYYKGQRMVACLGKQEAVQPGDPDAEDWVAAQAVKILEGEAAHAAAGIRRRATTYGYTGTEREGADTCAAYLTAKNPYLGYANAVAQGWPIATGVIEGACRHLVKDRMDITAARWGMDGAKAIPSNSAPSPPAATSMTTGPSTCNKNTSASTVLATVSLDDQLTSKEPHPPGTRDGL